MYIVIELQTTNGKTSNIVTTKPTYGEAMSAYHMILASAAISKVECHTAMVITPNGEYIDRRCYEHPIPVEGE